MLLSSIGLAAVVALRVAPVVPPTAAPTCTPPAIAGCPVASPPPLREPARPQRRARPIAPEPAQVEGAGPVLVVGSEAAPQNAEGTTVPPPRVYRAMRTVDAIVIDGKATERTWQMTPGDDRFTERQPAVGAIPPVRTTVRVAYDDSNLYVFLDAQSRKGDVIVRTLRRDNFGIYDDDTITVKIDPANTGRDAVALGVNAEGAQIDSLALDDGRQWITEWDAVWFAETQRRDDGYTIEYQIPFAILGIKSADEATIGFNISRDHPTRNATYDLAPVRAAAQPHVRVAVRRRRRPARRQGPARLGADPIRARAHELPAGLHRRSAAPPQPRDRR